MRCTNRRLVVSALVAFTIAFGLVAGQASAGPNAQITVYAAASLTNAPEDRFGPDVPVRRLEHARCADHAGSAADVFASARTLPNQLFSKGLCLEPVVFTRNTLVMVVPKANPAKIRASTAWPSLA